MKTLTENQMNFILENFFKKEEVPGWKNIATKLLNTGSCIVAGDKCVWIGGIGNFIETKEAENAVGCLLYEFDLDYFLTSHWYKEIANQYISTLYDKKREIVAEYDDIISTI